MGRPRKEKPNHATGMYEVKVTVGHKFDGTPVRKSFYSSKSKEAAKAKAEQYKIEQAVYEQTGENITDSNINFDSWARKVLDSLKGTIKDNSFNMHYKNTIENHLIPYFGKRKLSNIKQIDIQQYFNKHSEKYALETLKKHRMALKKFLILRFKMMLYLKTHAKAFGLSAKKKQLKSKPTQKNNLI